MIKRSKQHQKQQAIVATVTSYKQIVTAINLATIERAQLPCPLSPRDMAYTRFIKKKEAELQSLLNATWPELQGNLWFTKHILNPYQHVIDSLPNETTPSDLTEIIMIRSLSDIPNVFRRNATLTSKFSTMQTPIITTDNYDENTDPETKA